jgi:hypothetical protein
MTDFSQAAAELAWFGTKLRGVLALTEEITRIGSLKQAGDEAQARLDALHSQHTDATARHSANRASAESEIAALKQQIVEHSANLDDRRKAGDDEIARKRADAGKIVADAQIQADGIVAVATAGANGIIEDAKTSAADSQGAIVAKRKELAGLTQAIADKRAEHQALADKHAQFLRSIGAKS